VLPLCGTLLPEPTAGYRTITIAYRQRDNRTRITVA